MRPIPEITAEQENFRTESMLGIDPRFYVVRRDPVEPVPVGTIIACAFRVTGYDRDCDGSLMARLEQVDAAGDATGWETNHLGLYPDVDVVLDDPGELQRLATRAVAGDAPGEGT